jgi:hypothetical protein
LAPFQFIDTSIAVKLIAEESKKSKGNIAMPSVAVHVYACPIEDVSELFVASFSKSAGQSSRFVLAEDAIEVTQLGKQGNEMTLSCKFKVLSLHRSNSAFYLKISAEGFSAAAWSTPFYVIKHKLVVVAQPPSIWYKDQGGRKNNIYAKVELVDKNQVKVLDREVQLRIDLVGEGKENQKMNALCTLNGSTALTRYGEFQLSARINEVSKRNQNLRFRFIIAPDSAPQFGDIAACITDPITVLSKGNGLTSSKHSELFDSTLDQVDSKELKKFDSLAAIVKSLEWRVVGYEYVYVGDAARPQEYSPIFRCPVCFSYKSVKGAGVHNSTCWVIFILYFPSLSNFYFLAQVPIAIRTYNHFRTQASPTRFHSSQSSRSASRTKAKSSDTFEEKHNEMFSALPFSSGIRQDLFPEPHLPSPALSSDDQSSMQFQEFSLETPSGYHNRQSSEESTVGFQSNQPVSNLTLESDVFSILCSNDIGQDYSAFDFYGSLVGFYKLDPSHKLVFTSLIHSSLDLAAKHALEDRFRTESQDRSSSIYLIQNFDGNLDYMKNYIALCHY